MFDPAVDRVLQCVEVADVDLGGHDPAVERFDEVCGLGEILGRGARFRCALDMPTDIDRDDVGALLGQPDRVAAALPERRAGDEGDLAFHPSSH